MLVRTGQKYESGEKAFDNYKQITGKQEINRDDQTRKKQPEVDQEGTTGNRNLTTETDQEEQRKPIVIGIKNKLEMNSKNLTTK